MFYLKYVLLEMTEEGQMEAQKEVHEAGDAEHSRESLKTAWMYREPWKSWISSLEEVGIHVLLKKGKTQKSFILCNEAGEKKELAESEGAEEQEASKGQAASVKWIRTDGSAEPDDLRNSDGQLVLRITDNAKRAEAYAKQGIPILGVLQEKALVTQSFDGVPFLVSDLAEVEPEYLEKVYRRQVGLPWEITRTKRCVIRESVAEDARAFYEIYKDPTVTEFMEDLPKDPKAFAAWLEDYTKHVYSLLEYGIWTICLIPDRNEKGLLDSSCESVGDVDRGLIKDGEQIIGRAGLTVREGYDAPELGFVIGEPWRGKGFAWEVCEAVLEYAKELEIPEVIAFAEAGNIASAGLLHKLGFQEMREVLLDGRACCMFRKAL